MALAEGRSLLSPWPKNSPRTCPRPTTRTRSKLRSTRCGWTRATSGRASIPTKSRSCIIMPPPNVTGELHLGHALTVTIEDTLIRWHRMLGDPTLWLPGVDHAGIATQNVVERELAKEGLTRHDLGREQFVARVWQWVRQIRSRISTQHMRLGASADWEREVFTIDEGPQRAVRETFVRLYNDGLIYRGERIINWCPRCQTALSDLEVDHEETAGQPLVRPLSAPRRSRQHDRRVRHRRHDPPRDDRRRHRSGREPGRRALAAHHRPDSAASCHRAPHPDHRRRQLSRWTSGQAPSR